jgi:hypothetical protein
MAAKRGQGKITTKRITRGKRKGQTIRGYVGKGGKFTELRVKTRGTAGGQQTRQVGKMRVAKGGKFKGGKFASLRSSSGQTVHRHRLANGKTVDVVVKPKKDNKTSQLPKRTAPSSSGSKRTKQRSNGSIAKPQTGAKPSTTMKRTSAADRKKPPPAGKVEGLGINRQKKNPRKDQAFIRSHDKKGRAVHIYPGAKKGTDPVAITVKKKRRKRGSRS